MQVCKRGPASADLAWGLLKTRESQQSHAGESGAPSQQTPSQAAGSVLGPVGRGQAGEEGCLPKTMMLAVQRQPGFS